MNSKEYKLPNGKKAVFEYDVCGIGKITLECMDELMSMIADRPQGWIPCSERLPNEDGFYLVTITDGEQIAVCKMPLVESEWKGNWSDDEVLAWMPLPKPWEGADDE